MNLKTLEKPIPVKYQKGYFKILIDLPLKEEEEFEVKVLPKKSKKNFDKEKFEEALKATQGISTDWPDGLTYTRELRKSWDERLKRLWGEK